jgi:hypothetical protein
VSLGSPWVEIQVIPMTKNVFDDQPAAGTVVAQLSHEEMEEIRGLGTATEAQRLFLSNPNCKDTQNYLTMRARNDDMWIRICKKYDIPFTYPLNIDYVTNELYISRDSK